MRRLYLAVIVLVGAAVSPLLGLGQQAPNAVSYKVLRTARVGGEGGFDYISADVDGRRLYVPRNGPMGQLMVFNLDTLEPAGAIAGISAGGAIVDPKSHHGFSTTKPITMWDTNTLQVIKTIMVDGRPDGIMFDPYNERVWVLSHMAPHVTLIDGKDGSVLGTIDLGGAPEQAVSDGKGTVYVNLVDKANIAVVDAKSMSVTAHYDLSSKGSFGTGLSLDAKNQILFAYLGMPSPVAVVMNAKTGNIIASFPTGANVDTVAFNPATMEAISAENAGSMTFIKENNPMSFAVEQTLQTQMGAKTLVLDTKTNHLLTMTAQFDPPAPNAPLGPGGRPARGPMVPGSFSILLVGK